MEYIHDNKPPLSSGTSSIFVDLVFWHPEQKDTKPLLLYLQTYHLGERSQTVEWLTKFTVRLSMWKGRYFSFLTDEEWKEASQDLIHFIEATQKLYHCKKIEYDTRAFSVGLAKKVKHEVKAVSELNQAIPGKDHPVWWTLKV
jgi:hypothetical protein